MNDGGPAFPIPDAVYPNGQIQPGANGMSLRDWFAGQALAGFDTGDGDVDCYYFHNAGSHEDNNLTHAEAIASRCFEIADAMLKARERRLP